MSTQKEIIVSLTSFPARINVVHKPIKKMLNNSVKPDRVVLYLTGPQFPGKMDEIPNSLKVLMSKHKNFEIRFVEEAIRSYTKLLPALKEFPNSTIITVDDDVSYKKNLIENLLNTSAKYPESIIAARVRNVVLDDEGNLLPYKTWKLNYRKNWENYDLAPRFRNLLTGVGGVLYPPNRLHKDVVSNEFLKLCPGQDDLWFWVQAIRAGTKIALSGYYRGRPLLAGSQKETLWENNQTQNDEAMIKIIERYPEVIDIVRGEE